MLNTVNRSLIVFLGVLILVATPQLSRANPASQALVDTGRGELFNNGNATVSGLLDARDTFADAVAADGNDQEAQAFYGVTHALAFYSKTVQLGVSTT
jgi:hypothetical protein